jgi:hypothetical protein
MTSAIRPDRPVVRLRAARLGANPAAFARDGYLHRPAAFAAEEVLRLRQAMAPLQARGAGLAASTGRFRRGIFGQAAPVTQHTAEPHQGSGVGMAPACDPRLLDVAAAILGPDIRRHAAMAMMKPARSGTPVPGRQDIVLCPGGRAAVVAGPVGAGGVAFRPSRTRRRSERKAADRSRGTVSFERKSPAAQLRCGAVSPGRMRPAGLTGRGRSPAGQPLSAR